MGIRDWFRTPKPEGNINEPCVNCKKAKRTLCIRASKPNPMALNDFGHANLALVEAPADGSAPQLKTNGNWPGDKGGASVPGSESTSSTGSTVKENYQGDWNHKRFQHVRCKEINEEQYQKLQEATKGKNYDYLNNNCAKWSGDTWKSVTGENLAYGHTNSVYNSPATLSNSISSANGGVSSNYSGSFYNFSR